MISLKWENIKMVLEQRARILHESNYRTEIKCREGIMRNEYQLFIYLLCDVIDFIPIILFFQSWYERWYLPIMFAQCSQHFANRRNIEIIIIIIKIISTYDADNFVDNKAPSNFKISDHEKQLIKLYFNQLICCLLSHRMKSCFEKSVNTCQEKHKTAMNSYK